MKIFRKNTNGMFVCEECEKEFNKLINLSCHLNKNCNHLSKLEYFNKWLKEENDDKCKICGSVTTFIKFSYGYAICCCPECSNKNRVNATYIKYGVNCVYQLEEIKSKIKRERFEKYGVEYTSQLPSHSKKVKETCLVKYEVEYISQIDAVKIKKMKTCIKNYGVSNPSQSLIVKNKMKETCIKKYGVVHPQQNIKIHEKTQTTLFRTKRFKNTDVYYQASYELDFLEKYYNKYPDITRGPSIKYKFIDKNKVYHPDFFIPSLDIIIEIKSTYFYNKFKEQNNEKEKATITNGFNYCLIVDKNYIAFENILNVSIS